MGFSDSDYVGDPGSSKSVSGFVLYVCGVPIIWRSKAQCSAKLLSFKAEWVAAPTKHEDQGHASNNCVC